MSQISAKSEKLFLIRREGGREGGSSLSVILTTYDDHGLRPRVGRAQGVLTRDWLVVHTASAQNVQD